MNALPQISELADVVDDGLVRLIEAGRAELAELERRRSAIEVEIASRMRSLKAWESAQRSLAPRTQSLHLTSSAQHPTKREAVLALLSESSSEIKLADIRRALIERGWMSDDRKSIHALEVAAIAMAERGELRRPRKGFYALATIGPHGGDVVDMPLKNGRAT
jgi:hypothetical protein